MIMECIIGKRSSQSRGFTLIELLMVVAIIAIMAAMVPSMISLVPSMQVRTAARAISTTMHAARASAASTLLPTRAVIDCQDKDDGEPCEVSYHVARFTVDSGTPKLTSWRKVPTTNRVLPANIFVAAGTPSTPFAGSPDNYFWVVFMPSGEVLASSHTPFTAAVSAKGTNNNWSISVNKNNGQVTMSKAGG